MKLLRIKLPDSLHARLKVQCAVDGVSMQESATAHLELALADSINSVAVLRARRKQARESQQPQPQKQEAR